MDVDDRPTISLIKEGCDQLPVTSKSAATMEEPPEGKNRSRTSTYPGTGDVYQCSATRNRSMTTNTLRPTINEDFYESIESAPNPNGSPMRCFTSFMRGTSTEPKSSMSSHRIPQWAWLILVHILGIRRQSAKHRPCLAIFLNVLTILLACVFTVTGIIHTVYDIKSAYSSTTVLIGIVNLMIGFGWICLGIYSNQLASKLFSNRNFAESVRVHSRTFFKISVAGLLIVFGIAAVAINCYQSYGEFGPRRCQDIALAPFVCHIMYISHVTFSVISLVWNLFVGCVLLSVCRTHTVGIRRFIKLLEEDARIYGLLYHRNSLSAKSMSEVDIISMNECTNSNPDWFVWDDTSGEVKRENAGFTDSYADDHQFNHSHNSHFSSSVQATDQSSTGAMGNPVGGCRVKLEDSTATDNKLLMYSTMTNDELLMSYWKISHRMRITSKCLQRWLASWIMFVLLYCGDYVLYWISHKAQLLSIIQCVMPLFLLFLIMSAFAEANGEGQRMIRCICPTESRLKLLYFLNQQPLQMQVFNFSITYNAILGVIAAFAVAFASRIILDEVVT